VLPREFQLKTLPIMVLPLIKGHGLNGGAPRRRKGMAGLLESWRNCCQRVKGVRLDW
jgi:hypothetical protein